MEVPVTEEEWTSIVNDKRYIQKFGRKHGLSPKGRAAMVAGVAAVLITVPILVKTLRNQPAETAQPTVPATETTIQQPTTEPSVTTATVAQTPAAEKSDKESASMTTTTKPVVAATAQSALHESSTLASVMEKRQPTVAPAPTTVQPNNIPSYSDIKVTPERSTAENVKDAKVENTRVASSSTPKTNKKPAIGETTVVVDNDVVAKNQHTPTEEPETEEEQFFIPSAFTPNGDGLNDLFFVTANFEPKQFEMYIFTRGSELLFSTRDMNIGWDGTKYGSFLPQGIYVYLIKYIDRQGNEQKRQGQVLLIP